MLVANIKKLERNDTQDSKISKNGPTPSDSTEFFVPDTQIKILPEKAALGSEVTFNLKSYTKWTTFYLERAQSSSSGRIGNWDRDSCRVPVDKIENDN